MRGPLSARALGLHAGAAVTDPAALVARLTPAPSTAGPRACAFMPHWQSEPDSWKALCARSGCGFIDPRGEPDAVVAEIRRAGVLITEAMHGAIVADALRVPWIPVRTREAINSFKWEDWCRSMAMEYHPHRLPTLWPPAPQTSVAGRMRRQAKLAVAARALARVSRQATPILSRPDVLQDRLDQLEERLDRLRAIEQPGQVRRLAMEAGIQASR